jgi:hypothetical protein
MLKTSKNKCDEGTGNYYTTVVTKILPTVAEQVQFNFKLHRRKIVSRYGVGSSGSGQRPVAGACEHGNESSGFIKGGEFLD